MKLNKLFLESDRRLREMQAQVHANPGDRELWEQYKGLLAQQGTGTLEGVANDDDAILKLAGFLENHILNHPLHERYLPQIQSIIEGIKATGGVFLDSKWNKELENFPKRNARERDIALLLVNLGDLIRSVSRPLAPNVREWYINGVMGNLDLNLDELLRICYL